MASLFRNSRSILTQFATIRRTATTVVANAGTQPKTTSGTATTPQVSRPTDGAKLAVRDAQRKLTPIDPIRPRPAGEPPLIPLVGKSLNVWGNIAFTVVLGLSAYFVYINYITNPEFYKSLAVSREAGTRGSHEQPADREGTIGQKIDAANAPKGALNKHL